MRSWLFSVCLLFFTGTVFAQQPSYLVKGTVTDSTNYLPTQYASISLIRASDSVLLAFTRVTEDGSFSLSVNSNEDCLLMISHPLFATSLNRIELRDSITALGEQFLISKRQLLRSEEHTSELQSRE